MRAVVLGADDPAEVGTVEVGCDGGAPEAHLRSRQGCVHQTGAVPVEQQGVVVEHPGPRHAVVAEEAQPQIVAPGVAEVLRDGDHTHDPRTRQGVLGGIEPDPGKGCLGEGGLQLGATGLGIVLQPQDAAGGRLPFQQRLDAFSCGGGLMVIQDADAHHGARSRWLLRHGYPRAGTGLAAGPLAKPARFGPPEPRACRGGRAPRSHARRREGKAGPCAG